MSDYTPKPGTFVLFRNDKKESDNHPDYKGEGADADGNPIWVNAWIKEGKRGKFMSGSIRLKQAPETGHERQQRKAAEPKDDEDVPF